jgi:class 3 adenylate cyclase/tetratricopeptide (TPR) repeat protein
VTSLGAPDVALSDLVQVPDSAGDCSRENGTKVAEPKVNYAVSEFHQRQLAAVMFTDIVDYTRLMESDEEAARDARARHRAALEAAVPAHSGRLIQYYGDGSLSIFASAVEAAHAALEVQRSIRTEPAVPLRIGIHQGEVTFDEQGVYGDAVNVAFRIQSLGSEGSVLVSGKVYDELKNQTTLPAKLVSEFHLKNVARPIRVFALTADGLPLPQRERVHVPGASAAPALPKPSSIRRRWRILGATAVSALGIFLVLRSCGPPEPELDKYLLVVAPFNISSGNPELVTWDEHFVDILSRNLDGAGVLRTVSPSVAIRRWRGPSDPASAAQLGRSTEAGLVVFGSLIPSGRDSARVTASILDVASNRVLDEISLNAFDPAQRLVQVSDSLTVELLRALGRHLPIGAVRGVAFGTLSTVPALKAFLRGEQFYRISAWDSAIAHYERALEADSTFALALRRIGLALGWQHNVRDTRALNYLLRAGANNRGLPKRDSLLVTADSLSAAVSMDDASQTAPEHWAYASRLFSTLEEARRLFPRDPEVWFAIGDARYHLGYGMTAVSEHDVLDAFDRSIALDPGFAPVYLHPIEVGLKLGGLPLGRRYAASYLALNSTDKNARAVQVAMIITQPQHALALDTSRMLDTIANELLPSIRNLLHRWPDSAEVAVRIGLELSRRNVRAPFSRECDTRWFDYGRRLAYRGHLREAWCALAAVPDRLLAEVAILGGAPPQRVDAMFERWLTSGEASAAFALEWWSIRGDTSRILRFLRRADSAASVISSSPGRWRVHYDTAAARAHYALAIGDTATALRLFQALPEHLCLSCYHPDRLIRGRLLVAAGRLEAAQILFSAWRGPVVFPTDVVAALEHARVAERLGEREEAATAYRFVVDAWQRADSVLHPYVSEARAGLSRLGQSDASADAHRHDAGAARGQRGSRPPTRSRVP